MRTSPLSIILARFAIALLIPCSTMRAEDDETFVESKLAGRALDYVVVCSFEPLEAPRHADRICIGDPGGWSRAYLCIDGELAKTIKPSGNCFNWSFAALAPGPHQIQILVEAIDGTLGLFEAEKSI